MNRVLSFGWELAGLARDYVGAGRPLRPVDVEPDAAKAYIVFLGYPRSGHSIIGALLDAHPDAVVSHELGALKYVRARFDRRRLFRLIARNARRHAEGLRRSSGYSYHVPGQWQGRWRRMRIVGDKMAEGATLRLGEHPWLLDRLRKTVGVPLRFIHVVRNPFDNIATMALRATDGAVPDLDTAIGRYFGLAQTVLELGTGLGREVWELRHEEFVCRPAATLAALCRWLGLEPEEAYLDACAAIVFERPHRSRLKVPWSEQQRSTVEERLRAIPHLERYRFDA